MAEDTGVWVKVFPDDGALTAPGWGDFTTNGDETTSDMWGPDAQGRMWKWAEWNEAKDYTVNLTGGLYHVLCASGANSGYNTSPGYERGNSGEVIEGYWEFPADANTLLTVGEQGIYTVSGSSHMNAQGKPSFIGSYGTQAIVTYGKPSGKGSLNFNDHATGYKSFITGSEREFGTGIDGVDAPGQSGAQGKGGPEGKPGCVIIATALPTAKALNWVHTTYHAEVNDGEVTAVYTQKHYADGTTTPLPTAELVDASYGVSEGWLFVDGELQPPPPPPEPTRDELIAELQARIAELQKDTK